MKLASTLARVRPLSALPKVLGLVLITTTSALGGQEAFKLSAGDGMAYDHFGGAIALSGSTVLVGAYEDDDNGDRSGSAYLFDLSTGQQMAKLLPNLGLPDGFFGCSVAISGNTAIVGSSGFDENAPYSGSAYLFDVTTGQQTFKLVAFDGAYMDLFGGSVAISGSTAIVGVQGDDDNGHESGSAYLFEVTTGMEIAKLLPRDGGAGDDFGVSVAISGNTAIVGSWRDDDNGTDSGSAYLFDVTTGQQTFKLLPTDGSFGDYFGLSVAISGGTAIVGSLFDDDNGSSSGSAYLFNVSTGQQIAKLLPSDGAIDDYFGHSVAISGGTAIIGASGDADSGSNSGSAYLFDGSTGQQMAKLLSSDGSGSDYFGGSVAIFGNAAVVGATGDDDNGLESGSAYLFDVSPVGVNYCSPAVSNSSGAPSTIRAIGSYVTGVNNVVLIADQLPQNQFGFFLNSMMQGSTPNPGGSQGTLCLAGAIGRYANNIFDSGAAGSGILQVDLTNTPTPTGLISVMAGQTWNFQAWYRDNNPGPTSNFTDGLSITFQ